MKDSMKWLVALTLFVTTGLVQADPVKDNMLDNYKAGWYPNTHQNKILTCPQTCKVKVNGVAEHEKSMGVRSVETYVCKFGDRRTFDKPFRQYQYLYGNQFDRTPFCYTTDMSGRPKRSNRYSCLCIAKAQCTKPDLVVTKINQPQWDGANNRSIITAEIKNIGSTGAAASIARVIDPSTLQSTGAPYNAIANTPALAAGASVTVTFHLPYWVYNPDADLEVTADYKGMVQECNENNNTRTFQEIG